MATHIRRSRQRRYFIKSSIYISLCTILLSSNEASSFTCTRIPANNYSATSKIESLPRSKSLAEGKEEGTFVLEGNGKFPVPSEGSKTSPTRWFDRRKFVLTVAAATAVPQSMSRPVAHALDTTTEKGFISGGYGREEYTNSITASRDTNISPKEAYDTIQSQYVRYPLQELQTLGIARAPRALDVGAGAGVSTQVLWELGYRSIDACDWSGKAWDEYVRNDPRANCPPTVKFYELDDESYVDRWRAEKGDKYDLIVFNFAINESKARAYARTMLHSEAGRLLAPVNTQSDYWLKQTYKVIDVNGNTVWSASDVGAWSVQFQPDVTQETCQGIWCAPFNGFQKKK